MNFNKTYKILYFNSNITKKDFEKENCIEKNVEIKNTKTEDISEKDIEQLLQNELDRYSYFAGYNVIEKLLSSIKNDIMKKHIEGVLNTKDALSTLNNKVLEEFDNYYQRLHTLHEIKYTYINKTDITLLNLLKKLAENIANPQEFKTIENNILNYIKDILDIENSQKSAKRRGR